MFIGHDSTDTIRYFKVNICFFFAAASAALHRKSRAFICDDDDYLNPIAGTFCGGVAVVVVIVIVAVVRTAERCLI